MLSKLENACDTETQSMPLNNYILWYCWLFV
jgi:hypothetical protein